MGVLLLLLLFLFFVWFFGGVKLNETGRQKVHDTRYKIQDTKYKIQDNFTHPFRKLNVCHKTHYTNT